MDFFLIFIVTLLILSQSILAMFRNEKFFSTKNKIIISCLIFCSCILIYYFKNNSFIQMQKIILLASSIFLFLFIDLTMKYISVKEQSEDFNFILRLKHEGYFGDNYSFLDKSFSFILFIIAIALPILLLNQIYT